MMKALISIFVLTFLPAAWAYNSKFVADCQAFHESLHNLDKRMEEEKVTGSITLIGGPENSIQVQKLQDLYALHDQIYAKFALLVGVRNLVQEYENLSAILSNALPDPTAHKARKFYDLRNFWDKLTIKRKNTFNIATMDTILRFMNQQFLHRKKATPEFTINTFKEWIKLQANATKEIAKRPDDLMVQNSPQEEGSDNDSYDPDQQLNLQKLYIEVNKILEKGDADDLLTNFFDLNQIASLNERPEQNQARIAEYRRLLNRVVKDSNMNEFLTLLDMEEELQNIRPGASEVTDQANKRKVQLDNDGIHKLTINYGKILNQQLNKIGLWAATDGQYTPARQDFQNNDPLEASWGFKNSIFYQDLWEDIKNQLALNKGNPSLANDLNDTLTAAVAGHYLKQRTAMQDDSHKYINGLVEEAIKGHSANPAMAGSLLETGVLYDVAHIINQATRYQPIDGQNPTDLTTDLLRACKTKAPFLNENCVDALDRLTSAVKDDEKLLGNLNNSIVGLRAQLMQIKDAITHIENQSPVIRRLEELHQQISNFALYNCDSASQSQKPCYMGAISNFDDDATINLLRIGDNLMGTFAFDDKSKNYTREKFNLFCKNLAKEELEFVKPACQQSKMFTTYDKYFNAHSWFSLNRGYYIDRDPITGKIFNMEKRPTAWAFLPKAIGNSLNDRLWASFMTGYIWSPTMINAAREVGFMQKEFNAQNEAVNNYVKATWDNAIQDAANYNSYLYNQYMMGAVSPNQVFSNLGQLTPDAVIGTGI